MRHLDTDTLTAPPPATGANRLLDLERFADTPLTRDPFDFLVVPGFVPPDAAAAAAHAFPGPFLPGVLPAPGPEKEPDDAFGHLLRALRRPEVTQAFGAKFGLELTLPTLMVTLRARTRPIDGQIHTDSETKRITALIYLNDGWDNPGGRLRLLRGPGDIENMIAEVPPEAGTLIAFRRSDKSWHGHKPFDGIRRAIMLNWMTDAGAARRELFRHGVSARMKKIIGH